MSILNKDDSARQRLDRQLDQELEDTFPASDALKITRRPSSIDMRRSHLDDTRATSEGVPHRNKGA